MAAATLANFRMRIFDDPVSLMTFVNEDDSVVVTVINIVADSNGKYILFYTIA